MKRAFLKDRFKHTHGILKRTHGYLVWEKFVPFFFLLFNLHKAQS